MKQILQATFGLLFITIGIYILVSFASWFNAFKILLQAGIVSGLFALGAILIFLAVLELKA